MQSKKKLAFLLVASVLCINIIATFGISKHQGLPANIRDILGVTHVAGTYNLGNTTGDFLNQGADMILALGSRTIKVWLHDPQSAYPFNSNWPASFSSLVTMAQHPYFDALFRKPFSTYILLVYSIGLPDAWWRSGSNQTLDDRERQQFHDLACYFLTNFTGTNKTFVFQNWESDWSIRGSYNASQPITQVEINGMIDWMNAHQAGVNQARAEYGQHGVHVYNAAEVNVIAPAMNEGEACVINTVIPHMNVDLVSYSSWDTERQGDEFQRALDYIAAQTPDSPDFGAKNVYIGEYGAPENDLPASQLQATVANVVSTGLAWGCPYIVYWELFCNEPRHLPVTSNDDVRGYWLIRPDGTRSWTWQYLREYFA